VAQGLTAAVDKGSVLLVQELKRRAPGMLQEHKEFQRGFEDRIEATWGEALDRYYEVLVCTQEAGANFNDEHSLEAEADDDARFLALVSLHARACLVASDI